MVQFLVVGLSSLFLSFLFFSSFFLPSVIGVLGAGLQDVTRRICLHGADEMFCSIYVACFI